MSCYFCLLFEARNVQLLIQGRVDDATDLCQPHEAAPGLDFLDSRHACQRFALSSPSCLSMQADWEGKRFMFDIVANKRNGLDVDK